MGLTEFIYGSVDGVGEPLGTYAVMTMEVPWNLVKDRIGGTPTSVTMVRGLEREYLDGLARELPSVKAVVGIGGGMATDAAKYFAWKRGCSLLLVPTIVSVDAYASHEIAVRDNGVVSYIGNVTPARVVIDYKAIRSAPSRLNTAGAGDAYATRTALFDWKLSHDKTGESYDKEIADAARRGLDTLVANASEVRKVTEKGIRTLVSHHVEMVRLCALAGKTRPGEGSEHVFFYTLEKITGRSFVHGEVVGTGIYLSSRFQSNEQDEVAQVMDSMGLIFRPKDCGISKQEFTDTLLRMKQYSQTKEERAVLPFSILDVVDISREDAEELWRKLSS